MQPRPFSVVRSRRGVEVCLVEKSKDSVFRLCESGESLDSVYTTRRLPLEEGRRYRLSDLAEALANARSRLRSVRLLTEEVLADYLTLGLGSVPAAESFQSGSIVLPTRLERRSASAAHPRGYRGTKYRPPKAAAPEGLDLSETLLSPRTSRQVMSALWEHREGAVPVAARRVGVDTEGMRRLRSPDTPPRDAFAIAWNPGAPRAPRLHPSFTETVLWACRGLSWSSVRRLHAVWERLVLRGNSGRFPSFIALLVEGHAAAIDWIEACETQPPGCRATFLVASLESEPATLEREVPYRLLEGLAELDDTIYSRRLLAALDAYHRGAAAAYIEGGLKLAAQYAATDYSFQKIRVGLDFSLPAVQAVLARLRRRDASSLAMPIWEASAVVPELVRHLRELPPGVLSSRRLFYYVRFLAGLRWDHPETPMPSARWAALGPSLPRIQRLFRDVPLRFADQVSTDLGFLFERWIEPAEVRAHLDDALVLLKRLAEPPMSSDGYIVYPLGRFLDGVDLELRKRLANAPRASYLKLDRACRRENDAHIVSWGLAPLIEKFPGLVADGLEREPSALIRVAKLLGVHRWAARVQILRAWNGSLLDEDPKTLDLRDLVVKIDGSLEGARWSPVAKALRHYLGGGRKLTPAQVARHRARLESSWTKLILTALESHLQDCLAAGVGPTQRDPNVLFALKLLREIDANRRGLRKFLKAYLAGDEGFLREHQATTRWLSRHPRVDAKCWLEGIETSTTTERGERVRLAVEQDPLEVLKLGSYVGSCLGLGGSQAYSAVAVLLDVNKQVVYARNESGHVLARQLVALSEAEELVTFSVYPESAKALTPAFRRFDRAYARHVGVPLCRSRDYDIALVLAQEWWDDSLWASSRSSPRS